jgi:hypothetical protein
MILSPFRAVQSVSTDLGGLRRIVWSRGAERFERMRQNSPSIFRMIPSGSTLLSQFGGIMPDKSLPYRQDVFIESGVHGLVPLHHNETVELVLTIKQSITFAL